MYRISYISGPNCQWNPRDRRKRYQTHLQARHEIGSLEQGQCADLVDNLGDLGVGRGSRSRGGLGGLPSPAAGCATGCEICSGGRDAQGRRADGAGELSAAAGCGLGGEGHGEG